MKKLPFITPERRRIAKIFKTHVEKAIDELGPGYTVDLQGNFKATPIPSPLKYLPKPNKVNIADSMSFYFNEP